MFVVALETPRQPQVAELFRLSDAYLGALYPAESNHLVDASELEGPGIAFWVARQGRSAVGCGALVCRGDEGEIKRMFVVESARGRGVGRAMLTAILAEASARNLVVVRLETGAKQREALGLYRRFGFVECGPFGSYGPDPLSMFMEKRLLRSDGAVQ